MARKLKIRNDDDKTIYELKLEDEPQNEKIKPGKVIFRFFLVVAVLALSVFIGYILHNLAV